MSSRAPPSIAGYVLHTPLGRGAYGEVWLGENRTTKRQVAVKFPHSRATLDWSLLDSETDRLAFLAADRRVVQLLDVGRDADPPFFVMEYVAGGSLARYLDAVGRLPVDRAAALFEEIVLGLVQVHAKGILHCDIKPSNILLDDERRPRLADFGQSRLTDDPSPTPAFGTMFYMAPEQADPAAVPDARWDVYALGAVLRTMLDGRPPHQSDEAVAAIRAEPDLGRRLARYRQIATAASAATRALPSRKVDKALADILARCLAIDPRARFSTVKEVAEALRRRREARGRRPMILLGGLGPLMLLAVMVLFGVRGYRQVTLQATDAVRRRAFESNSFAASFIARSLEGEIRRHFDAVSKEAAMPAFQTAFRTAAASPLLKRLAAAGPERRGPAAAALIDEFQHHPSRLALDAYLRERLEVHTTEARRDPRAPRFVSIFALDAEGTALAVAYGDPRIGTKTVGRYFAWRPYFHGGPQDLPSDTPRALIMPIDRLSHSVPYRAVTTDAWRFGVSAPLHEERGAEPAFAGVLVFSVDIGKFDYLAVDGQPPQDRFAVLVDARDAKAGGTVILHPYFARLAAQDPNEQASTAARPIVGRDVLGRMTRDWGLHYEDPLGREPGGEAYQGRWIAAARPVRLPGDAARAAPDEDVLGGLVVLVQERSDAATGPVERLGSSLLGEGALALLAIGVLVLALWFFALRALSPARDEVEGPPPAGPRPLRDRSTLSETGGSHG